MLSKINLACAGALILLPHLAFASDAADPWSIETVAPSDATVAAAERLPTASFESICGDAQAAALPESEAAAYQSCVNDERKAYNELRQKWGRYSVDARVTCAEPGYGVPASYVELQTCLDMQPGGSLTIEGPAPGASPPFDAMASQAPMAGGPPPGSSGRAPTPIISPMETDQSPRRVAP